MKNEKPPVIKLSENTVSINKNGAICEGSDGNGSVEVTAAELDSIAAHATHIHDNKSPKTPARVTGDHDVTFVLITGGHESTADQPGDVYIGCQRVPYATVIRAQKLSQALRSRKNRQ